MRHRRDYPLNPVLNTFSEVLVDYDLDNALFVDNTAVLNSVANVYDSFIGDSVYELSNGNISLGLESIPNAFAIRSWLKLPTAAEYTLLKVENSSVVDFSIVLNTVTNNLTLKRRLFNAEYQEVTIPCVLPVNEWFHLFLIREYNNLKVLINFTEYTTYTNLFYPVNEGTFVLGGNFTGFLYNFILYKYAKSFPGIHSSLLPFKRPVNTLNKDSEQSYKKLIDLHGADLLGNALVFPYHSTDTYYEPHKDRWRVTSNTGTLPYLTSTQGLCLVHKSTFHVTQPYTVEIAFELTNLVVTDVVIASQWYLDRRSWLFWIEGSTSKLKFTYYNNLTNITTTAEVGFYVSNAINYFSFTVDNTQTKLYFNGTLFLSIDLSLKYLDKVFFNHKAYTVSNTGDVFYLHRYTVSKDIKYTQNYLPYKTSRDKLIYPNPGSSYNYHSYSHNKALKDEQKFSISGSSAVSPNSINTYTVTLNNKYPYPVAIQLYVEYPKYTDLLAGEVTCPTNIIIPANTLSGTFNVAVSNYTVNKYKNKFFIVGYSEKYSFKKVVSLSDIRVETLSYITSLTGYLDGYLTKDSVTAGTIPNLTNTLTGTTSGDIIESLYGKACLIDEASKAINITSRNNVRTVILLYMELVNTPYRGYLGSDTLPTFNGGSTDELIGNLDLPANTYLTAIDLTTKIAKVCISENNATLVAVQETPNKLLVYEKTASIWSTTPVELNTGVTDSNTLVNTSVSINSTGNIIAVGIQNANNGEGVVQIWEKVTNTWLKTLHLGSPTPAPSVGGFGTSVAINNDGTKLFVGEVGSNNTYLFEKNTLWNSTPVETWVNIGAKSLSCNSEGTLFAVVNIDTNTTKLYKKNSTWVLLNTFTYGYEAVLSNNGLYLAVSDLLTNSVKVFNMVSGSFVLTTTLTGTSNFGYSIDINNNGNVLVGSPTEHKLYEYLASMSYTYPVVLTSSSLANTDYYGYSVSLGSNSKVVSNYYNQFKLFTTDSSTVTSPVVNIRQNYANTTKNASLLKFEPQILSFTTNTDLTVNKIGKTYSNKSLNGLVYGCLLFNRALSSTELANIENLLKRYLQWNSYLFYEI